MTSTVQKVGFSLDVKDVKILNELSSSMHKRKNEVISAALRLYADYAWQNEMHKRASEVKIGKANILSQEEFEKAIAL